VIGLLAEPVLIPGLVGMALVVLVVIWEPVGMAPVLIPGPVGMALKYETKHGPMLQASLSAVINKFLS